MASWAPLLLWITPALATLGTAVAVLISSRASTFMEAYQLSGSLVLVVIGMVAGQVSGVLVLGPVTGLVVGAVVWAVALALMRYAVRSFRRRDLISRV